MPLGLAFFARDAVTGLVASPRAVGIFLIANGFVLLIGNRAGKGCATAESLGAGRALAVGAFQLAAVVPGLSRSGMTVTGGTLCGLERAQAVRFSFIMSIPAILGANIMNVAEIIKTPVERSQLGIYAVGMIIAAVTGFFALKLVDFIARKGRFSIFSIYCFAVGAAAVIFG